ncbi:DUF4394 domain-containing protein [Gloeobacter morelensis]|uniref:DUF4394 domain-containing protein n=1 Tax=Gloeobacter morelensis MG652769 TaxID=2781736 RepID=A0ABY3PRN5_9CYAN|nr:DUF4394 domain-containing protein [Gloeobacter morelensis]UFP96198.1 DUF4394 domain-containing protein [Gloeobacter morelensis MG652769]
MAISTLGLIHPGVGGVCFRVAQILWRLFMRPNKLIALAGALAVAASALFAGAVEASESPLIGLTDGNTLVRFNSARPGQTRTIKIRDVNGTVIGIDFRPANKLLYALTDTNYLYTINPATGASTFISVLPTPFGGGNKSGFDFNPSADRLRLVGKHTNENLRVNVDTNEVFTDTDVVYDANDVNAGKDPNVSASGYINNVAAAPATRLYNIDIALDVLVIQDPPNDGILKTVGPLGADFGDTAGFDIFIDDNGVNSAFAISGATLYAVDLVTGKATNVGTVGDGSLNFVGLAAVPAQ